jgi:hypothetical protein
LLAWSAGTSAGRSVRSCLTVEAFSASGLRHFPLRTEAFSACWSGSLKCLTVEAFCMAWNRLLFCRPRTLSTLKHPTSRSTLIMRSTVALERLVAFMIVGIAGHASSRPVCSKIVRLKPRSGLRAMSSATLYALPGSGLPFGSLAWVTVRSHASIATASWSRSCFTADVPLFDACDATEGASSVGVA